MIIDKDTVYITRGCGDRFDPSLWKEIKNNRYFCKPQGGLWASPEKSEYGWMYWCECEDFDLRRVRSSSFRFKVKDGGRIYTIDTIIDLLRVPYKTPINEPFSCFGNRLIDFERMKDDYDAIFLSDRGQVGTRYSDHEYGMSLYGWNCETLLVLNPDVLEFLPAITP